MRNWREVLQALFAAVVVSVGAWAVGSRFDLNKGEWAAWVQAIGAIGAILGAVWIANKQHNQALDRERLQTEARKQEIREAIFIVIRTGNALVSGMPKSGTNETLERYLYNMPKVHFANTERLLSQAPLYEANEVTVSSALDMMEALDRTRRLLEQVAAINSNQRIMMQAQIFSDIQRVQISAEMAYNRLAAAMPKPLPL